MSHISDNDLNPNFSQPLPNRNTREDNSTEIVLSIEEEITPDTLRTIIIPYVSGIEDIQHIINVGQNRYAVGKRAVS